MRILRKSMQFWCIILMVFCFLGSAAGRILRVPSDYQDIQAGISAATDNDTILVAPGTYEGAVDFQGKLLTVASNMILTGDTTAIAETIIDGNREGATVMCTHGEPTGTTLMGVTVINSTEESPLDVGFPGVWVGNSAHIRLQNVSITGHKGPGVYGTDATIMVLQSRITENHSGNDPGAGFDLWNSSLTIRQSIVANNRADRFTGGISSGNSEVLLDSVTIKDNQGYKVGGIRTNSSELTILHSRIVHNHGNLNYDGGDGDNAAGGLSLSNSKAFLQRVLIAANQGRNAGGIEFNASSNDHTLTCIHVTVANNRSTIDDIMWGTSTGGAWLFSYNSAGIAWFINSIFWQNNPVEIHLPDFYGNTFGELHVAYTDVQGGDLGVTGARNTALYWHNGNIDANPLFADTSLVDFTLEDTSLCIDAGTTDAIVIPDTTVSIPSEPYYGAAPDMGVYEYKNTSGIFNPDSTKNPVLPTAIQLASPYPNPFNAGVTIQFTINTTLPLTMEIFNIQGKRVCVLREKKHYASGSYQIQWDGRNQQGVMLPSGIYFLRLTSISKRLCKPMIMLK